MNEREEQWARLEARSIPTRWRGYEFRSKLEFQWAMYFTALGICWEYETIGVALDDGTWYQPDFLLYGVKLPKGHRVRGANEIDLFVEVKGPNRMTSEDMHKVQGFSKIAPILVMSAIPYMGRQNAGHKWWTQMKEECRKYPFPHSFKFIDGTRFGAFLGADMAGAPKLFSEVEEYRKDAHEWLMGYALMAAKRARTDHGINPEDAHGFREAEAEAARLRSAREQWPAPPAAEWRDHA